MRALCYYGVNDLRVSHVSDPGILNPHDAIIQVTLSSVCGSDLHLIDGYVPTMKAGDIIGHEFLGEVVETGPAVQKLKRGDRVVVGSIIGCGECWHCTQQEFSLCDNSNPNAFLVEKMYGAATAGIFGYSHAFGGYAGSHAEYIRVPFADTGCFKVPEAVRDESAVFCSDAFPTGWMAADMADIHPGDVVAIWGAGGVGQMAMHSAWALGAGRVIAIDRFEDRLQAARDHAHVETLNYTQVDIHAALKEMTAGRGPDRCIDAVGMEAHSARTFEQAVDRTKQALHLTLDRPTVLRDVVMACRKGGTVSIVGVYAGLVDSFPMGAAMNKALTFKMGQMHAQRYIPHLLDLVAGGAVDPSYLLTHRLPLTAGAKGYDLFKHKQQNCMRVVFDPQMQAPRHHQNGHPATA